MDKKGFTLVELLAVIIILGLLALITTTSVTKLVGDAKTDLSDTQIKLIKSAAEIWGADNINKLPSTNECIYIALGDLKNEGLIDSSVIDPKNNNQISDDLKIKISNTLSTHGKEMITYEVNPESITGCKWIFKKPCSYTKDDKGYEMVTCGTESFYIMSKNEEDSTITMLAQYNLDVGGKYESSSLDSYQAISNPTGIQNPIAKGWGESLENVYGTVAFSTKVYWTDDGDGDYSTWVYGDYKDASGYQQNIIFPYVESYKRYLIDALGVDVKEATLMSREQAFNLGCVSVPTTWEDGHTSTGNCKSAPPWVSSTSYWLGTAGTTIGEPGIYIDSIHYDGTYGCTTYYSGSTVNEISTYSYTLGVRPVITISTFNVG